MKTIEMLEEEMIKMYYKGFTVEQISRKFKVSITYVQQVFKKDCTCA